MLHIILRKVARAHRHTIYFRPHSRQGSYVVRHARNRQIINSLPEHALRARVAPPPTLLRLSTALAHIFACASQPPFLPPQHGCLPKGHGPAARALERDASLRHSSPPPTVAPNDARSPSLVAHSHGAAAHRSSLFSRAHPKRAHEGNTHRCSMFSPCEYVAISHVRCHRTAAAAAAAANPPPCSSRATAGAIPPGQHIARHRQPPASQHTHQ